MKINRNNYETFLIDYLDGRLGAAMLEELQLFLDENPDIREEFEGLENISLEIPPILFPGKSLLKKTEIETIAGISENTFENYFIAFHESDLTLKQQNNLQTFLAANPRLKPEFTLHVSLILEQDKHIIYHRKEELKRKPIIGVWWLAGTGVAAAIALFFVLFNFIRPDEVSRQPNPLSIVQLAPKSVAGISAISVPSSLAERKSSAVQMILKTDKALKTKTVAIAKLENKPMIANLSGTLSYARPEQHAFSSKYITASNSTIPPEEKKRGALARIINHNLKLLAQRIPKRNKNNSSDPTFVKILDGGISAFNTLTGSEVEMTKVYTKDGRLTSYQIESETLNINRSIPESGNGQ